MDQNKVKGLIFTIDKNGTILDINRDDFGFDIYGKSFIQLIDNLSIAKALSFISTLKNEKSALGWELNLNINNKLASLFFSGTESDYNYVIVASQDSSHSRKMFNNLMKMSNEQINEIRKTVKENVINKTKADTNKALFDNMTELNNEMAHMQRKLTKNNRKLEQLNSTLAHKNAELDQFAYIVSHDLKAPLRGISSVLSMIEEDFEDSMDEDMKEMFSLVRVRSDRMNDLITSILSYSRAGEADKKTTKFNLKEMVSEIIDSLGAPKTFKFILPTEFPDLECSYVQLSQVLANLIGNAVKYHDQNSGNIELKIEKVKPNWLRYSVTDDGPGIPEKYHSKLFGMFETANEVSRSDSTGVGLAIVKKLVELTGGEIGLNSTVGEGSEFWFTWPINANSK